MTTAQVDRPVLPDDYGVPGDTEGVLPWSHVAERLAASRHYWICTTRPDGRPHATPIWGVFFEGQIYFDGSPETRRGKNLAVNPAITVHLESGEDVVIVDGTVEQITPPDRDFAERLAATYAEKYAALDYSPSPTTWDGGGLYRVTHRTVIAWTTFPADMTRWRFPG
jgi:nitroimidazol reductase NimA-like FMN-containing flavoprotein (pyridoxamine 5'-phosphate oxidase superfamily)